MPEARLLGNPPVKVKVSINHDKCQHEADEATTTCVCNRPHDYDENQATDLRGTRGLDLWIFYMKHLWELRVGERSYICQSCLLFTRFRKHMPSAHHTKVLQGQKLETLSTFHLIAGHVLQPLPDQFTCLQSLLRGHLTSPSQPLLSRIIFSACHVPIHVSCTLST